MTFLLIKVCGQKNYLNPCIDWGQEIKQIKAYNERFERKLNLELSQDFMIRFIAKPTFSPEYAFQIEKVNDEEYKLIAILFQENLCSVKNKNRDSINIDSFDRIISFELASSLDILFKKATDSSSVKKDFIFGGTDGVNYYFYRQSESSEINCGECWSPSKGTPLFELVTICDTIIHYAKGESIEISDINKRIENLFDNIE